MRSLCAGRQYYAGCRCNRCRRHHRAIQKRYRIRNREKARENSRHCRRLAIERDPEGYAARKAAANLRYQAGHPERVRAQRAAINRRARLRRNAYRDPAVLITDIRRAIPASLPPEMRDDIAQDLAVMVLTTGGNVTRERVTEAIRAYWRRYPLMAGRDLSFDAPAYNNDGDSRERWIDRIADPASIAALDEDRAAARMEGGRQ